MADNKDKDPLYVTEQLCTARHETVEVEIDGLKKAVYASSAAVGFVVMLFEFILRMWR